MGGKANHEVVFPAAFPSIGADPAVIEAAAKADEIAGQLRAAEAERAELAGQIPGEQRKNPDAARMLIRAEKLLGSDDAGDRLDRLDRYAKVKESLPALRAAADIAARRVEEAREAARLNLHAAAKEIADETVKTVTRAILRAAVQVARGAEVYRQLAARNLAGSLAYYPFGGQLLPIGIAGDGSSDGLVELLGRLSHQHGLRFSEVEAAAPELFERGRLAPGHRGYFANG